MSGIYDVVCAARDAGLCVVPPAEDGTKQPITAWRLFQHLKPGPERLRAWYVDEQRSGLGIICGHISGNVEMFEFDDWSVYEAFLEAAQRVGLGPLVEPIRAGYEERSPGGGIHWLTRCDRIAGNTTLARRPMPPKDGRPQVKTLIQTRGEGGFAILAPSNGKVHPSGGRYELLQGGVPTIATISPAERADLWALARSFDEMPKDPPRETRDPSTASSGRPGDDFNQRGDVRDLLESHGWRFVYSRGGTDYYRRPDKNQGVSATFNHGGSRLFYPFTSSTVFEAERSYSPLGVFATLEHGGDYSAAAKALAERYGMDAQGPRLGGHYFKNGETLGPVDGADHEPCDECPEGAAHKPVPPTTNGTGAHDDAVSAPGRRPTTDLGNAERLIDHYGDRLRYCAAFGSYLVWDGRRWGVDQAGEAMTLAKKVVRSIYREAADADTKERRAELASWAKRSEAAARLEAMLRLAQSSVPIATDELDRNPWLLNVANGTINLRTGELRPHRRTDYITKLIDVPYVPDAGCPRWEQFLLEVLPDEGSRRFIQRAAGYSATGSARERKLILPYGAGRNGKGVCLQTLRTLLGEYAVRAPSEMFLARKHDGIPNDVAQLRGARFVFASETGEGRRLAEAKIKDLTGGEDIAARFMRGEWFSFAPTFTAWLATNHKPVIMGTDPAIWDRIALVPFTVRFRLPDEPEEARPVADPALAEKLEAEREGILAWVIRGAVDWYRDGLGTPHAVREATAAYRDEMDTLGDFLAERCVVDPQATVGSTKLYEAYKAWSESQGERPKSQKWLTGQLEERGFTRRRQHGGTVALCGLRLLEPDESPPDGSGEGSDVVKGREGFFDIAGDEKNARVDMPEKGSQPFTEDDPSPPTDGSEQQHCWQCKEELLEELDERCEDCGWLACRCGACGCKAEVPA